MKGKKTEVAEWIKQYLKENGANTSNWKEYKVLYNRYSVRIRKYKPSNYQQFVNLCTFPKQTKKSCGARDLGESKPREPFFNEERYWKDQKKDFEAWKIRMQRYRGDKIRNQEICGETSKEKDRMPYTFRLAMKCLSGCLPEECYPEELESYRKELQNMLEEERGIFGNLNVQQA